MTSPNLAAPAVGRTGVAMADRPPPLRLLTPDDGHAAGAEPARPAKRKLPRNLYYPSPAMQTLWCRLSIDRVTHRRTTGCRDVRNVERAAVRIRAEIEAELRGTAAPKRLKVEDALKDLVRSLARGRGGADQQETVEKLVRHVLAIEPVRFADELHVGIYDAWVAMARRPRPKKPNGLARWTIHMRAQNSRLEHRCPARG